MRRFALLALLALLPVNPLFAWSKKGHDIIAEIAQRRLTEEAQQAVTELLAGRSMVYHANWMDAVRDTKEYKHTKAWHYFNVEKGGSFSDAKREKDGDLLSGIEYAVAVLNDREFARYSKKEHSDALKMLIHMVADMHQPMHLGRNADRGGNTIPVVYFSQSTSLHAVWDYHIVEGAHAWSYTEWADQLDVKGYLSRAQVAEIVAGEYSDWLEQVHIYTNYIYKKTPIETRISYDYINLFTPIVEELMLHSGVRLAHILNRIYTE